MPTDSICQTNIFAPQNDFMAESANIDELVEEAEGMNILTSRKDASFSRAMSNSFGFGGTNAHVVVEEFANQKNQFVQLKQE